MNGGGKEYAVALFSLMLENGDQETIYSDLMFVEKTFKENPEYIEFLINPSIMKSERIDALQKVFEDQVSETVFSFLNVILLHRDMHVLLSAIEEFRSLYEDYMRIADAVVTSAVELSDEQKKRLVAKLSSVTGKNIRATYVIDKDLLGGVSVTVDGKHFDGSVRQNLKNLKEVLA